MSKGLKAFNRLLGKGCSNEDLDIIEQELKERDELSQRLWIVSCENSELLKYKQALEIIKNKDVDVEWFKSCLKTKKPLEVYNDRYDRISVLDGDLHYRQLTQEEFDLLKEVLL